MQDHALRGEGFFTACRVPMAPHLLLGKQVAVWYCPRGVYDPRLLSRGKGKSHKASLVSLFCCFVVIAGGIKKQTPNFFQFCAVLQVPERKCVSVQGWSEQGSALLVCCFLASLLLQHGTISVYKFKATLSKEFGFQKLTLCI